MPQEKSSSDARRQELEEFRAQQEEMLNLSRQYSQDRLAVWAEELRSMEESWATFQQNWQGSLEQMSGLALSQFEGITSQGAAAASQLTESWGSALAEISGNLEQWGEQFLKTLEEVSGAWTSSLGGGTGEGWSSWIGAALGFGGWFHQGGVVAAHQGMVISPGILTGEEQLVLAQAGEGILPRETMARLGEQNFEALRTGQFAMTSRGAAPRFDINIQVQGLEAAGLDWDRVVQRHLLPALQKELGRRW